MSTVSPDAELESIEVDLLLEGVARQWGFDLRSHARPLLLRRLRWHLREERLDTFSALQARVLHDGEALEGLLRTLSCTPASLFSDPAFFRDFRARVVPVLRTWPSVRVWHAGCGTGEDTYALAILLLEEGLWGKRRLYASDSSEGLLADARTGVLPLPSEGDARRYVEGGRQGRAARWPRGGGGQRLGGGRGAGGRGGAPVAGHRGSLAGAPVLGAARPGAAMSGPPTRERLPAGLLPRMHGRPETVLLGRRTGKALLPRRCPAGRP
ncbi:CheR family methyltransferase [Myxococcus sp. RHSTA-1-4]|uniref:CheR family methyltransferase n=1 Tax=Myxococcus sp. RHSTA-1-4 TaxID=2874601 RepID=UPI001CBD4E9E|nr:CheR family methyltransferase [Myxococcus sp. RHSTA-1-4]